MVPLSNCPLKNETSTTVITSGIISPNRFFVFERLAFFKAIFLQLNSFTFNTSAVFQQISANGLYITSLFHINFTKRKINDKLSFFPSAFQQRVLFVPLRPPNRTATPVALQVEESWRITFHAL